MARDHSGILRPALPWGALALTLCAALSCSPRADIHRETLRLEEGWRIAPAGDAGGEAVSAAGFDDDGWTATNVPSTVVAALARAGEVPDPYFGRNVELIPAERFEGPWWYRTEFELDASAPRMGLVFEGINYSADVWLNGTRIGQREDLLGAFRMFEIDVSEHLVEGLNALAVLVHPPKPGDLTLGFVDWNPTPPDKLMGLWRPVELRRTGDVTLDEVFVRSDLDLEPEVRAELAVEATLTNHSDRQVRARVAAEIGDEVAIEDTIELGPGEARRIELSADRFAELALERPRLWWPSGLGEPELYELRMSAAADGAVSDRRDVTFGIRHIEDYLTDEGYRGYEINGERLLIRGGGWVDDMLLAADDQNIEDQIRYVKHMNLNTIRLEGFWGNSRKMYELADRYGILVMPGWSCQWEWEEYLGAPVDNFGGIDTEEEMSLVTRSLRDQVVWLRNHPSIFVWVLASDMLPRAELEGRYRRVLSEIDPTRPALASCATGVSDVSGPSGVKMNGPYDWVPPIYWYVDRERGGAYGFNTETGPGPQPPPIDSIKRMLPEENWWPIDDMWEFHCGRNQFNTLDRYKEALDRRYGESGSLEEFARLAQVANYEAMRAMFESFSLRRPATTGLIQWMLNSAWPEMYWQLYDWYLVPNGAFYGARDASRPLNVAYDRADRGVVAINDTDAALDEARVAVRVYDLDSRLLLEESSSVDVPAGGRTRALELPAVETSGKAYFVDARLTAADGSELARSFYWLPIEEDVLDWDGSLWFVTPTAKYADLTGIAKLPEADLDVEHRFEESAEGHTVHVTLANPGERLAFFVELSVAGADSGRRAAPVLWSDNYVSLLPGERLELHGEIPAHALAGEAPVFRYRGVNVAPPAPETDAVAAGAE